MKPPKRHAAAGKSGVETHSGGPDLWRQLGAFALTLLATFVAYLPCLRGEFLWDDAGHVTAPALQTWSGLVRIWVEPGVTQQYYPLLHSAFWLEHRLWGDATLGYHLINVLWHAASAALLVAILRHLAITGALLAGLVFAVHPVAVESVAWISEQKNTLSTVFALAAVLAWVRFDDTHQRRHYVTATLWFLAALLTKTVTATVPAALLVIAWWRRGRLTWRGDVMPLLPWLALGAVAGLSTRWFEAHQIGAAGDEFSLSVVERFLLAGRVGWFYLGKLVFPVGLAFFYPRWTIDSASVWSWLFFAATLGLLAFGVWGSRRSRAPLAATLLYGGALFPVLGFFNVYPFVFSYVADHFQYLASVAMIAFLCGSAAHGLARLQAPRRLRFASGGALLLGLGALTWQQSKSYRDIFSLYETTLARNPDSWVAHLNLGTALDDAGRTEESLRHLQRALALKPDHPETLNSLGNVLNQLNRPAEALPLVQRALQREPRFAVAANTLGVTLMALGRDEDGRAAFQRAIKLDRTQSLPHANLAWALARGGRFDEAVAEFEEARQLQPDSADVEFKWGLTLMANRRIHDAVSHFSRAVEQAPDDPEMRNALGAALLEFGRPGLAEEQFFESLRLRPDQPRARLGLEAAQQNRTR
jgi:tetratricopeptide (TPR) repeat protein